MFCQIFTTLRPNSINDPVHFSLTVNYKNCSESSELSSINHFFLYLTPLSTPKIESNPFSDI